MRDRRSRGEGRQGQQLAEAGQGPPHPPRPAYLQLRGGRGLVHFLELRFSPSRVKLLQQDAGADPGEGQAPVHLHEAAVDVLPRPEQLLFGQGEGRGAEPPGGGESRVWPRVCAQCGRGPWPGCEAPRPPPRSSPEGPAGSVLSGTVNGAVANSSPGDNADRPRGRCAK